MYVKYCSDIIFNIIFEKSQFILADVPVFCRIAFSRRIYRNIFTSFKIKKFYASQCHLDLVSLNGAFKFNFLVREENLYYSTLCFSAKCYFFKINMYISKRRTRLRVLLMWIKSLVCLDNFLHQNKLSLSTIMRQRWEEKIFTEKCLKQTKYSCR